MSELFTRPQYFQNAIFHRHTDRTIGWLELFYDLVYVATLIQIGNFLSDNLTLVGLGQFMVLMFVVWWAWSGETLYQNRFVADDIIHRIIVFIQIFGVAAIGLSVSAAFGELYVQFTLAYALVRGLMLVMYARAYHAHVESRTLTIGYMWGFAGGILIWLGALLLPEGSYWIAWLGAILFEIIFFGRPVLIRAIQNFGADYHHLVERFGIFTIIVLGEAFVKVLDDAQGTALNGEQMIFGMLALTVLYGLWWLYFSDTAGKIPDTKSPISPLLWSYGHLFLASSLVAFGVSIKKLFAQTTKYASEPLPEDYRFIFTVAIVMFLLAMALIDFGVEDDQTAKSQKVTALTYVVASLVVVGIGFFITTFTATQFTGVIAGLMVLLVVFNVYQTVSAPEPSHHAGDEH